MIVMVVVCGITRVVTYGISHSRSGMNPSKLTKWVTNPNYETHQTRDVHGLTHSGTPDVMNTLSEFHAWQSSIYSDLITQFKNIKVGADSLLDHSNLIYLVEGGYGHGFESGRWHPHSLENMIAFNAGGKRLGMKLGKHINGNKKHPLSIVNAAMKSMGINSPHIGKVKSIFPGLVG